MSAPSFIITFLLVLATTVNYSFSAPVKRQTKTTTITYKQFLGLQIGWTRDQITQYLNNNPGIVNSETEVPGIVHMQFVQYTNANAFGVVELILTNGKLTSKAQSGLNLNQYPITRQAYDQILIGMSRAQVTSIVGSEGQIMAEAEEATNSVVLVGYNGSSATSHAVVKIRFQQGNVISKG